MKIEVPSRDPDYTFEIGGEKRKFYFWFHEMIELKDVGTIHRIRDIDGRIYCVFNDDTCSSYIHVIQNAYQKWLRDDEVNKILLGEDSGQDS